MNELLGCLVTNRKVTVRESYRKPLWIWNSNTTTSHRMRRIRLTGERHKKVAGLFAGSEKRSQSHGKSDVGMMFMCSTWRLVWSLWFGASLLWVTCRLTFAWCPKYPTQRPWVRVLLAFRLELAHRHFLVHRRASILQKKAYFKSAPFRTMRSEGG